jgi:hypothetical protein
MPGSMLSASSYALKHYFEVADDGFYITNGQFKGAMLEAGFEPLPNQTDRPIGSTGTSSSTSGYRTARGDPNGGRR